MMVLPGPVSVVPLTRRSVPGQTGPSESGGRDDPNEVNHGLHRRFSPESCACMLSRRTARRCARTRAGHFRASEGPLLSGRHRGVGAVLLLRHDRAGGALHGQPASAAGPCREHRGLPCVSRGARSACSGRCRRRRSRRRCSDSTAALSISRRCWADDRRSLDRPAQRGRDRRRADERSAISRWRSTRASSLALALLGRRQRSAQRQYLRPGRRAVPAEDETSRVRAYAIFSMGINVGATLGPLVCGLLAQLYGWHYGVRRGRAVHPVRPGDVSGGLSSFTARASARAASVSAADGGRVALASCAICAVLAIIDASMRSPISSLSTRRGLDAGARRSRRRRLRHPGAVVQLGRCHVLASSACPS